MKVHDEKPIKIDAKPVYFHPVRAPSGAWCIELRDALGNQMGLASKDRAPRCFEASADAIAAALVMGLKRWREQ